MVPRIPSWTKGVAVAVLPVPPRPFVDKRCCSRRSPCPSASLRGQKVLQLQFSVSLRVPSWTKGVAVAVLRGPSVALRGQKVLQLQFSVSLRVPSWTKGVAVAVLRVPPWPFVDKRCCSCSSPCPSVALRGQKVLQLQFSVSLRGSSWTKSVAVAVLRGPPWPFVDKRCCSCSSPWSSVALRGQKVLQLQFSVSLRGPSWTKGVAVAVLRGPSVALRGQKVLQLQFSVSSVPPCSSLPPWPFVDKRCCSCSSPCPSVALRGQKVLQLQFSVVPSVAPSWTKGLQLQLPCPSSKRCCSCSSPCPSVALRGQKVLQLQFSVVLRGPSWTKGAVAVLRVPPWFVRCLRGPPWPFVDKRCCSCSSPCPSVDQKTVLPALSCILVDE